MGTSERSGKYASYILTQFPIDFDSIHSICRFMQDGSPINCIIVIWSLPEPPPSEISFDYHPYLLPCEVPKLHNDQMLCNICWDTGDISKYCSNSPKCAWYADEHDSKTCTVMVRLRSILPPLLRLHLLKKHIDESVHGSMLSSVRG